MKRLLTAALVSTTAAAVFAQGPLAPPGGPGATMKSLDQIYSVAEAARSAATPVSAATTPGDADAQFVISTPGSYYLTGNITGEAGKYAIEIAADGVTLDLSGYTLTGVSGALTAIEAAQQATISNGHFRDWPDGAVSAGMQANLSGLSVSGGGGFSIFANGRAIIRDCTVTGGSAVGIDPSGGSLVENCSVMQSTSSGFQFGDKTIIRNCISNNNGGSGFVQGSGGSALVEGCVASDNDFHGISVCFNSMIRGNVATGNTQSGIQVRCGSNVVMDNHLEGNATGIALSPNNEEQVYRNTLRNNATNVSNTAGNYVGPVTNVSGATNPFSNLLAP